MGREEDRCGKLNGGNAIDGKGVCWVGGGGAAILVQCGVFSGGGGGQIRNKRQAMALFFSSLNKEKAEAL